MSVVEAVSGIGDAELITESMITSTAGTCGAIDDIEMQPHAERSYFRLSCSGAPAIAV